MESQQNLGSLFVTQNSSPKRMTTIQWSFQIARTASWEELLEHMAAQIEAMDMDFARDAMEVELPRHQLLSHYLRMKIRQFQFRATPTGSCVAQTAERVLSTTMTAFGRASATHVDNV